MIKTCQKKNIPGLRLVLVSPWSVTSVFVFHIRNRPRRCHSIAIDDGPIMPSVFKHELGSLRDTAVTDRHPAEGVTAVTV